MSDIRTCSYCQARTNAARRNCCNSGRLEDELTAERGEKMSKEEAYRIEAAARIGAGVVTVASALVGAWVPVIAGVLFMVLLRAYMAGAIKKLDRKPNDPRTI